MRGGGGGAPLAGAPQAIDAPAASAAPASCAHAAQEMHSVATDPSISASTQRYASTLVGTRCAPQTRLLRLLLPPWIGWYLVTSAKVMRDNSASPPRVPER